MVLLAFACAFIVVDVDDDDDDVEVFTFEFGKRLLESSISCFFILKSRKKQEENRLK